MKSVAEGIHTTYWELSKLTTSQSVFLVSVARELGLLVYEITKSNVILIRCIEVLFPHEKDTLASSYRRHVAIAR